MVLGKIIFIACDNVYKKLGLLGIEFEALRMYEMICLATKMILPRRLANFILIIALLCLLCTDICVPGQQLTDFRLIVPRLISLPMSYS